MRLDHEHAVALERVAGLILRDQHFVQFFAGADADLFDLAIAGDRLGQVADIHARDFWHEDLAAVHLRQHRQHELHGLVERQPEAGHPRIGNGDLAGGPLFQKHGDHAAATTDDVAITHAGEACPLGPGVRVSLHEELLGTQLRRAVEVDRVDCFVRAKGQHAFDPAIDGRLDDIAGPHDVGEHRLEWVVFAGRHLLEGRRVHHDVDPLHGPPQAIDVPHVAQKKTHGGMAEDASLHSTLTHLVLLKLVAAENNQSPRPIVCGAQWPQTAGRTIRCRR